MSEILKVYLSTWPERMSRETSRYDVFPFAFTLCQLHIGFLSQS